MKPTRLLLVLAIFSGACSLTNSAEECPTPPSTDTIYFPLREGLRWSYEARSLRLTGTEANPAEDQRGEGTITWELTEIRCDGGEFRFVIEAVSVWDVVIERPPGDAFSERLFTRGTARGFTREGALLFEDTIIGDTDFGVGPRALRPALRWHDPAGSDTLVVVRAGVVEGEPFEAQVTLVRERGIIAWHLETGTHPRPRSETHVVLTERSSF